MTVVLLLLASFRASAQAPETDTAAEAEVEYRLGADAYARREYLEALAHFLRSQRLAPNANVVLTLARTHEELGELDKAYQRYVEFLDTETLPDRRVHAEEALARLAPSVALVHIESDPPGATIYVERRNLGARGTTPRTLALPPGPVHVELDLEDHAAATAEVTAAIGERKELRLTLVPFLGTVDLEGTAGARVYLGDGTEVVGTVPGSLRLTPGPHVLRLVADGYAEERVPVTVGLGAPVPVDATLERLTGKVQIEASVRKALVEVDGRAAGYAPVVLELPVGGHRVRVSSEGFEPRELPVTVGTDEVARLDVRLGRPSVRETTSVKADISAARTPAVVTVVPREVILARGYGSVAEVLASVPGFYDVYDLSTHNFAVRGVSGGARASGSVIKLMIDGQPVPYRPTGGNFTGEELVPIDAVERIEIVKGPSSALYGANAFLAVVNVITRTSGGSAAVAHGGFVAQTPSGGGQLTLQSDTGAVDVTVAGSGSWADRSGLFVSPRSPMVRADPPIAGGPSRDDTSTPRSLLARVDVGAPEDGIGRWTALANVQHLETGGEFFDLEPMTHQTRVALENRVGRIGWRWAPTPGAQLDAWAALFDSGPTAEDRIGFGRTDQVRLRVVGTTGGEGGFELSGGLDRAVPGESRVRGLVGVDYVYEDHLTQAFDYLLLEDAEPLAAADTVLPGAGHGHHQQLHDTGVYAQALVGLTETLSGSAGARFDYLSGYPASVSALNLSPRGGLVVAPPDDRWSVKLLYGQSFKAPSAEQLYTRSIGPSDIHGNRLLEHQIARNLEVAGSWQADDDAARLAALELEGNVYATHIDGLAEYVLEGGYLQAENAVSAWVLGGESSLRVAFSDGLGVDTSIGVAVVPAGLQTVEEKLTVLFGIEHIPSTFPPVQLQVLPWALVPGTAVRVAPEVTVVGPRSASQSNNVADPDENYVLDPYVLLSGSVSASILELRDTYRTHLALRVVDVLGTQGDEPGVNGIDYPALGPRAQLTLTQGF